MSENKLKVALISAGMITNCGHIPAYQNLVDKVDIQAICDLNKKVATDTAEKHGIKHVYTDADKMLKEIQPDLVSICTPNATHADLVKQALLAGANVVCEKPLTLTYSVAKELFSLAEKQGLILVTCQTSRFNKEYLAIKEYIDTGALGTLYYGEINRIRRRGLPTWGTFHKKYSSGGGALADLGVHALDALLWMMNSPPVSAVSGSASNYIISEERGVVYDLAESGALAGVSQIKPFNPGECDVEEFAAGMLRTTSGISINFKIAWAANLPTASDFSILGSKMGVSLPDAKLYSTLGKNQVDLIPRIFALGQHDQKPFSGHYYFIENVVNHLLNGEELIVKPHETLNVIAAIDLFYRSIEMKREVFINELEL